MEFLARIARNGVRPWRRLRPLALAGLLLAGSAAPARAAPSLEYQIKAVFLFNFAQFVEWPPRSFAGPDAPMIIGVLGDDPFGASLDDAVRDERVRGHPLVVRRYRRVEDAAESHILFISSSEANRLPAILSALRGRSILTVGDSDAFARSGGIIRLVTEDHHIRMRINLAAAKAADLTISSKLLRPAQIVYRGKD